MEAIMATKRVFAAIDLSHEARHKVAGYIDGLKRDFSHLRVGWEKPEKLHITLRFAGSIDNEQLRELTACADEAARTLSPFEITIFGMGAFLKRRGSNVLWLGLAAGGGAPNPFDLLAKGLGNPQATRKFRPHLTIARLKDPEHSRDLVRRHFDRVFDPIAFRAEAIVIYESRLLPTGSVYTALSRHPFRVT